MPTTAQSSGFKDYDSELGTYGVRPYWWNLECSCFYGVGKVEQDFGVCYGNSI